MLTIRAWVDAHGEASDGGKTVPGLFFFLNLDHLRMEKPGTGDEGRGFSSSKMGEPVTEGSAVTIA